MCNHINLRPYIQPRTPFATFYKELWENRHFFITDLIAFMVASILPITPELFMKIFNADTDQSKEHMLKNYLNVEDTYNPQNTEMRDVDTYDYVSSINGILLVSVITKIVQTVDILKPKYKKCVGNPK